MNDYMQVSARHHDSSDSLDGQANCHPKRGCSVSWAVQLRLTVTTGMWTVVARSFDIWSTSMMGNQARSTLCQSILTHGRSCPSVVSETASSCGFKDLVWLEVFGRRAAMSLEPVVVP